MTIPYAPAFRGYDYLTVAFPPMPEVRAQAERVHVTIDPVWTPVTGEISRNVNAALWTYEGRPVTAELVADLASLIESRMRESDPVRWFWERHGKPLRFVIPLAPGFEVACEPFGMKP